MVGGRVDRAVAERLRAKNLRLRKPNDGLGLAMDGSGGWSLRMGEPRANDGPGTTTSEEVGATVEILRLKVDNLRRR